MVAPQDMGNQLAMEVIKEGIKFLWGVAKSTLDSIRAKGEKVEIPETELDTSKGEADIKSTELQAKLDTKAASIEEENIVSLLKQIEVHNRNWNHYETQKATMGMHTPPYVETGIITERSALIEKSKRLRSILERLYKTRFDLPQLD